MFGSPIFHGLVVSEYEWQFDDDHVCKNAAPIFHLSRLNEKTRIDIFLGVKNQSFGHSQVLGHGLFIYGKVNV